MRRSNFISLVAPRFNALKPLVTIHTNLNRIQTPPETTSYKRGVMTIKADDSKILRIIIARIAVYVMNLNRLARLSTDAACSITLE
jgi:hypothetical protein